MPADTPAVEKIEDLKFLACPLSVITQDTWDLLWLVNRCINADGDILHLPDPDYAIDEQSPRFNIAVDVVRRERGSRWMSELRKEWARSENGNI